MIDRDTPYANSPTVDLRPDASISLAKALARVLASFKEASLAYEFADGIIAITTEDQLPRHTLSVVYDVRDLISATAATGEPRTAAINELHKMIIDMIARESWVENGGTTASIEELAGLFVITQTAPNHRQILELLTSLRSRLARDSGHTSYDPLPAE